MSLRMRRIGKVRDWSVLVTVALISSMALASGARADGEWKIAEKTMTELEAPEASIFGTASESFKLSVAWYASEIECSTLATEAPTKIFQGGTSEAIVKLSSCQILGPPFVAETCETIEPIELEVAGQLLLHSGKTYELFKAQAEKTALGAVKFKEGAECPLPLSNELKGSFVAETEAGERKEQPWTFNSAIEALFGDDSLSFGTHPATLKGKSLWAMAAGYKGLKWAAVGKESAEEEELKEEKELEEAKLHKEKLEEEEELEKEALELETCERTSGEAGWYICGNLLEGSEGVAGSGTEFVMSVPGWGVDLLKCNSTALEAVLKVEGALLGTLVVSKCNEETFCETPPVEFSVEGKLVLDEGEEAVLLSAEGLAEFLGPFCTFPEESWLVGSFFARCGQCEEELKKQDLTIASSGEDRFWLGELSTEIEGNVNLELSGEQAGEGWGGEAE